jgi:hypothetical protein
VRKLALAITTVAVLGLATAATAVLPSAGSKFKGTTSAPAQGAQKYKAPVSFKVAAKGKHGRKIKSFKFGSLGCFGVGGGNPSSNPYATPYSTAKLGSIGVKATGKFSKTKTVTLQVNAKTKVKVKGKFTSRRRAKGKITVTQTSPSNEKCGPATVTFKAKRK